MPRIFVILGLIIMMSSCSIFKKTTVDKKTTSSKEETKKETTVKTDTKERNDSNVTNTKTDKSVTTTERKVDTTVATKKDSVEGHVQIAPPVKPSEAVKPLDTTIKQNNVSVHVKFDPKTGVLDFKAVKNSEYVKVHVDEKTTTQNDITTNNTINQTKTKDEKKDESNKEATKKEDKTSEKIKTKEPDKGVMWIVAIILVVIGAIIFVLKKFKII